VGSLALRPGDSLTIPKMALSVGFIRFVSSTDATQAKELLTLTPVGLTPTEHVSLCLDTLARQNFIYLRIIGFAPIPNIHLRVHVPLFVFLFALRASRN